MTSERTSQEIRAEIEVCFGFFPPFFEPAAQNSQVLENLWQQTLSAYVENPLNVVFKEKLNALLSRFCPAPYCMVVHSAALRPLGITAREVLQLLESPLDDFEFGAPAMGLLPASTEAEAAVPEQNSRMEHTMLFCSMCVFLENNRAGECQVELRRLLGDNLYGHLVAYLAYIKTCHTWIDAHPEISHEADQRSIDNLGPMLAEEPELRSFFEHYRERVAKIYQNRALQQAAEEEHVRSAAVIQESEEKLRLLVDGAKDYAMIMLDIEGRITSWNLGAERLLGYTEADVLGSPIDVIFTPEDQEANVARAELAKAADQGKAMDKRWHVKKNGERMWADGLMEALCNEQDELKGFAKILRDSTTEKMAADILKDIQTRLLERERNIASQLQAALQPDLPDSAGGLEMARVYEAALGEATVGGDFYDVFSAHDRTILVLGDMSGKGLAAASQVATIRNMLRAYLYSKAGIAEAVNDLNRTICTNGLLSGFATLFVGCYDAATSTISYINCGQEPGIIRKANSSDIVLLEPNGPVMGLIRDSEYTESSVAFATGDALAIFSDGLTDVGPNRREMLGAEGVAALLGEPLSPEALESPAKLAHALADMLMTGVNAAGEGGVHRDDICLLIAVVA